MSVRGEFRRLAGDLLAILDAADGKDRGAAAALEPLVARAVEDLPGAAEATLHLLPALAAEAPPDTEPRRRFEDAYERLEAVCRIILGR